MSQRMLLSAGVIIAFLLATAPTSAKELYRWTDEKGVTHYSDTKPEGVDFERRAVTADPVRSGAPAAAPAVAGLDADAEAKTDGEEKPDEAKPKGPPSDACLQARSNLEVLNSAPDVSMDTDGDGQPETLDAEARERAINSHTELVKNLCDD